MVQEIRYNVKVSLVLADTSGQSLLEVGTGEGVSWTHSGAYLDIRGHTNLLPLST